MRSKTTLIPDLWETDWIPLDTARDGNVPGPVWKPLTSNEESGACTYLMHLPPNWHDEKLDWHPGVEEGFILAGETTLGTAGEEGYSVHAVGNYLYRPPGILHGPVYAPTAAGTTIFQRMGSEVRILRYEGSEFPQRHLQPITDQHENWPVPWMEECDTRALEREPSTGGWAGAEHRWIYRNSETGGGCLLIDLPAGWEGTGSPARGSVEEFVVAGSMTAGEVEFGRWGYAYREPGDPAGSYVSEGGAELLCVWDEADEMAASQE